MQARRESKSRVLARRSAAPPSSSFSPAGSISIILIYTKIGSTDPIFIYAGSKGVEPLIEVLETSVIPFNYEPSIVYCTKILHEKEMRF